MEHIYFSKSLHLVPLYNYYIRHMILTISLLHFLFLFLYTSIFESIGFEPGCFFFEVQGALVARLVAIFKKAIFFSSKENI